MNARWRELHSLILLLFLLLLVSVPPGCALENGLARTPPMGWNSWNRFACNINEDLVKSAADALVSSGMKDVGYEYVVIDDCWQVSRDAAGNIIADAKTFRELKNETASDALSLQTLVQRTVEIKSSIVAKDEFDRTGERALLNFGHTIGHGIERAGNYEQFLHGEAVSLGIVAACAISAKKAGLPAAEVAAVAHLLQRFGLPTRLPPDFPREKILDGLKFDKKFERGEIRFVVTPKIGSASLSRDVMMDDIREAVERL